MPRIQTIQLPSGPIKWTDIYQNLANKNEKSLTPLVIGKCKLKLLWGLSHQNNNDSP